MLTHRELHASSMLNNGQVLVTGGYTAPGVIARTTELYSLLTSMNSKPTVTITSPIDSIWQR